MDWSSSKVNVEFKGERYYLAGAKMGLLRKNRIALTDLGLSMNHTPGELVKAAGNKDTKARWKTEFLRDLYFNLMSKVSVTVPITDGRGGRIVKFVERHMGENPEYEKSLAAGAGDVEPNHTMNLWTENWDAILPHLVWQPYRPNEAGKPEPDKIAAQLNPMYNPQRQAGITAIQEVFAGLKNKAMSEYMKTQIPATILNFDATKAEAEAEEEMLKNA